MLILPLAHVTGAVEPGEVFGGFGPVDGFLWRGACVGGCGARPGCREEYPWPECSGCGRRRHGIIDGAPAVAHIILPVPARVLPGELGPSTGPPANPSTGPSPIRPWVLRPAAEMDPADVSLPAAVRGLLRAAGPAARVTAAVAARADGTIVASLVVRVPGVGFAAYWRSEGGAWTTAGTVLVTPHLRRVGVTEFAARLSGVEYVPPAPRPPAAKATCPGCGAQVSATKDGAIYKSHRCRTGGTGGRS